MILSTILSPIKSDLLAVNEVIRASLHSEESKSLKSKITKSFNQEVSKYLSGKWDIIQAPGKEKWGGMRKTMSNDINNWYNAKIRFIKLEFYRDEKTGILVPRVYMAASGDNVSGDAAFNLSRLQIYKAYQSPEGKEYKKGY